MSQRIVPVIITVGISAAFAAALGLSPIGLSTGQAVPSICHVPPGNPEQAHEIPPDDPSYPAHLPGGPGHEGDFLIVGDLTCPATVPTLPTLPDTTQGDPVPTDPTTTDTTVGDPVPTDPSTTVAGTAPTTAGTTPASVPTAPTSIAATPVATVAVLPTGTVAQTSPTLPSSR